jgi:hypothetical protein
VSRFDALDALDAAFHDRDLLAAGWTPPGELWAEAPLLHAWCYGVHPRDGGLALVGFLGEQARTTAPIVAMTTGAMGFGWARTTDRWLRLSRTDDVLHQPGSRMLPETAYGHAVAAVEAGYRAPRRSLQPEGHLDTDPRWEEAALHCEQTAGNAELAFAVFYARRKRVAIGEATKAVASWWTARTLDFS